MKALQVIKQLSNTEDSCPFSIKKCELFYNEEDVRMLLRVTLDSGTMTFTDIKIDVCCYGKDGFKISVMEGVPYVDGGMYVEIPSLMTDSAKVIVRSAKSNDGIVWRSESTFDDKIEIESSEFSDTAKFDSLSVDVTADDEKKEEPINRKEKRQRRYEEEEEIRQFIKNDPEEKKKRLITRIVSISVVAVLIIVGFFTIRYIDSANSAYTKAMNLYNSGRFEEAKAEFDNTVKYIYSKDKKNELDFAIAMTNARCYDFKKAAEYFKKSEGYPEESFANYRSILNAYANIVSAGRIHSVALTSDGKVLTAGSDEKGQCNVSEWQDIIDVSAGGEHTVGLSRNNVVMATGDNSKGQCDVGAWKDVVDVSAGDTHTVAVLNVGRVVAAGDDIYGQCDVDDWSGVLYVSAGAYHTVGLKIDGTVIATGRNDNGECNVGEWENVVLVAAGNGFTAGLTKDGKIYYTGRDIENIQAVKREDDVLSISAGSNNIYALYVDGKVKAFGASDRGQGHTDLWKTVAVTDGGENHGIAVSTDGTAYGVGSNEKGQATVSQWNNVNIPKQTVRIRKGEKKGE